MIRLENLDFDEALRYMGCKSREAADSRTLSMMEECEKLVIENSVPRYRYKFFEIEKTDDTGIQLKDSTLILKGNDIRQHLKDCFGIILMCATLSGKIDALIRKTQLEDMTRAVIVNALASVAIEQLCDKAEVEIYENLDKCYKTWRYSPGYGDFPIELQKDILTVLDAPRKIGLCTGCSMTLTPIKSVTAVTGLSHKPVSPRKRGCLSCNLRNTCQYRKVGNHCVQ